MGVITSFVAGRADHQSLIILLFILSLGFGIRMLISTCSRLLCYCAGLVSAFAIWVSIESLLFSLVVYLALGIFWRWVKRGLPASYCITHCLFFCC
jgi:hypothetical protein